jgi:hypothetical protein
MTFLGFIELIVEVVANPLHLYLICGYRFYIILKGRNSHFIRLWFNGYEEILGYNGIFLFPCEFRLNLSSSCFHIVHFLDFQPKRTHLLL